MGRVLGSTGREGRSEARGREGREEDLEERREEAIEVRRNEAIELRIEAIELRERWLEARSLLPPLLQQNLHRWMRQASHLALRLEQRHPLHPSRAERSYDSYHLGLDEIVGGRVHPVD